MKKIFFVLMLFPALSFKGQIVKVDLQASGLTCSMCSNGINKAIRSLDFVDKVDANIKNSSFEIQFKPDAAVDFDKVKKKVEDAGFFVASFLVTVHVDNLSVSDDAHLTIGNSLYHFVNTGTRLLSGNTRIRVLDKGFVSAKEYKKNNSLTKMPCYKTGEMNGKRVFHVTI